MTSDVRPTFDNTGVKVIDGAAFRVVSENPSRRTAELVVTLPARGKRAKPRTFTAHARIHSNQAYRWHHLSFLKSTGEVASV